MKKFNIKDKYNFDFFRSPQILYGPPTFYQKKDKKVKGKKIFYAKDGSSYYFVYKHKDNYQFITAYSDINNPNISMNNPDMHFLDKVNENESVKEVKVKINGKIINVLITINDEVSLEDAKAMAAPVLEALSKKQKEFYDVEVMIDKDGDSAQFPIIGYKHHSKKDFVFTKDREEQPAQEEAEN